MKYLFSFLFLLFFSNSLFAQSPSYLVFENINVFSGATIHDSLVYTYSGGRGGEITDFYFYEPVGIIKYDTARNHAAAIAKYGNADLSYQVFDASNNILLRVDKIWNGTTGVFENSAKDSNTYDASNNLLSATGMLGNGNVWNNYEQVQNTYNSSNQLTQKIEYVWSTSLLAWRPSFRCTYTYSGSDLTMEIHENYNTTLSTFIPADKKLHFYVSGKITLDSTFYWSGVASSWITGKYVTYTYNSSGQLITKTSFQGDRYSYTYNTAGDMIQEDREQWNTVTGVWNFDWRQVYGFDANHNMTSFAHYIGGTVPVLAQRRFIYSYTSANKLAGRKQQMWSGSSWVASPSDSFMRIFPNAFVGIEETKPVISKLLVYPTPANSVCYVDMHVENMAPLTITIYNLEGRILRQSGHSGNTDYHISIPVSDLPAGNYILSAEQNNQRVAKQLSIVR